MIESHKFILVTQRQMPLSEYLDFIRCCAEAGITSVQLREKGGSPVFMEEFACGLKAVLQPRGIPLLVNDDLAFAKHVHADGVHLGQQDGCPQAARLSLGVGKIIGLSVESQDDLIRANKAPVDYIAASAVFPTKNKNDLLKIWGLNGVRHVSGRSVHPVVAIGGITLENVESVLQAGAVGIAVIGAVHDAKDPVAAVKLLRRTIDHASALPRAPIWGNAHDL